MEIYLEHYSSSHEITYVLYAGNKRHRTDLSISRCLGLDINEYRKRLISMGIPYTTDYMGEIYLKQIMSDEKFIDAFKKEFATELILAKLENKWERRWYIYENLSFIPQ